VKGKKYLGIGYILAGAVFLCNPMISVFDILPDFIGYLLVLGGIYAMADINIYLSDARKQVKYLAVSSLVRALSILFIFGIAAPREQSTLLVLVAFALGVIDCILLVGAWKNIFGGLTYLATGHSGEAVLAPAKRGSVTDRMHKSTVFSLIFIQVMALLPEFASFTDRGIYTDLDSAAPDISSHIGLLRATAIIAALAVGIVWVVKMSGYIRLLKKDEPFFESLNEKYASDVLAKPHIFAARAIRRGLLCISAGLVLGIDFYDSGLLGCNIIPDVLSAALLVAGILMMRKQTSGWQIPTLVCSAYGLCEVAVWLSQYGYFKSAAAVDIFKSQTLYGAYYRMCAVTFGGELLFLAALLSVILLLHRVIKAHTGVLAISSGGSAYSKERTKFIHKSLTLRLVAVGVVGILAVAATVTYFMSLPHAYNTLWEAFWIINMALSAVLAVVFISFSSNLSEQIEYKYQLV